MLTFLHDSESFALHRIAAGDPSTISHETSPGRSKFPTIARCCLDMVCVVWREAEARPLPLSIGVVVTVAALAQVCVAASALEKQNTEYTIIRDAYIAISAGPNFYPIAFPNAATSMRV